MITNPLNKIKYYTYCEKCGEKVYIDTSIVYTSLPPMYRYDCPKCGNVNYIFCHDAEVEVSEIEYENI